ncbi:MAG: DNA topoisomerase 3 [Acidobacteriaceae bacterium]
MSATESGTVAVLAEKPSVARDIARVLGAAKGGKGYLEGNGYVVTWAIGHLVSLAEPHQMNPEWRKWRLDSLPILPQQWPLVVYERSKDQFEVVQKILTSSRIARIVCATDAGREGELIFRYIYEASGSKKPFSRLWISSLTPDAIRRGFANLRPGSDYDRLADAACGRSRADWLVGMNLSRAYSIVYNEELSVGRVQTPTLAMIVERELALRSFVPEDYLHVVATFQAASSGESYDGTWFRPQVKTGESSRLPADGEEANQIIARARSGQAAVESLASETVRTPPPLLYDLTDLQRHANRLYGFSAQKTLDLAQALYEQHKLISYPRTDSRYLSTDIAQTIPRIVAAISSRYQNLLAPGTGERPLGKRYVDDTRVGDHHAIIPTAVTMQPDRLTPEENNIYDLVCRRLLMLWHEDYLQEVTTVITAIRNETVTDRYRTTGTVVRQAGWKVLDLASDARRREPRNDSEAASPTLPATLAQGQAQNVIKIEAQKKKTRPPQRFTDATILTAMQTAGKSLDEKELSDAMKETGLGTPATRAAIIEVLLKRGYATRTGKSLEATEKGLHLIEVVHPEVKSPAMTGQWEAFLNRIHDGQAQLDPFLERIREYVRSVVGRVSESKPRVPESPPHAGMAASSDHLPGRTVAQNASLKEKSLNELLKSIFGFSSFRPNQEAVCQAVAAGEDALLVMPTGSGKSLCYQLPGLARGGTTLVISPLIALMDDQVHKLKDLGLSAECIHSGRNRESSRQACVDYIKGNLQFLFIAPERLRVPGFPEMLAKHKPSLVAIDEAHCISEWGHDFRPDYRMLGQYLPSFRPAPALALTATATSRVQKDIASQLGLTGVRHFIHGFRRGNIAIEVVEVLPSDRPSLARAILLDPGARPAIIYTPTRKRTEYLTQLLSGEFRAGAYHAGLDAQRRQRVQADFMSGKLEVMVATTAFGMGIDKANVRTVIHIAFPGSLEGYYQEIGRAGRDGEASRAILMYSYGDRYTHDFFLGRDYPPLAMLDRIFAQLSGQPQPKAAVRKAADMEEDIFDKALEKLWIHKGAVVDYAENVSLGSERWRSSYSLQMEQKQGQVEEIIRFAQAHDCRMKALVRHFGDTSDGGAGCEICDFCAPDQCIAQKFREPTRRERVACEQVLKRLRSVPARSTGKLYEELYPGGEMTRDHFEEVLGGMARAGMVTIADAVFEKQGKRIPYKNASISPEALDLTSSEHPFLMRDAAAPSTTAKRERRKSTFAKSAGPMRDKPAKAPAAKSEPHAEGQARLEQALRAWRLTEAKRRKLPAFRIFGDRTLQNIVNSRPQTDSALLAVPGIGAGTVEKYGAQIYHLIATLE